MNRKYTLILCICMVSFFGEILGAGTHQKLYMNTNNDPQLGEPGSKSMYNKIYMTQNTYHLDVDEDVAKLPLKDNELPTEKREKLDSERVEFVDFTKFDTQVIFVSFALMAISSVVLFSYYQSNNKKKQVNEPMIREIPKQEEYISEEEANNEEANENSIEEKQSPKKEEKFVSEGKEEQSEDEFHQETPKKSKNRNKHVEVSSPSSNNQIVLVDSPSKQIVKSKLNSEENLNKTTALINVIDPNNLDDKGKMELAKTRMEMERLELEKKSYKRKKEENKRRKQREEEELKRQKEKEEAETKRRIETEDVQFFYNLFFVSCIVVFFVWIFLLQKIVFDSGYYEVIDSWVSIYSKPQNASWTSWISNPVENVWNLVTNGLMVLFLTLLPFILLLIVFISPRFGTFTIIVVALNMFWKSFIRMGIWSIFLFASEALAVKEFSSKFPTTTWGRTWMKMFIYVIGIVASMAVGRVVAYGDPRNPLRDPSPIDLLIDKGMSFFLPFV